MWHSQQSPLVIRSGVRKTTKPKNLLNSPYPALISSLSGWFTCTQPHPHTLLVNDHVELCSFNIISGIHVPLYPLPAILSELSWIRIKIILFPMCALYKQTSTQFSRHVYFYNICGKHFSHTQQK